MPLGTVLLSITACSPGYVAVIMMAKHYAMNSLHHANATGMFPPTKNRPAFGLVERLKMMRR